MELNSQTNAFLPSVLLQKLLSPNSWTTIAKATTTTTGLVDQMINMVESRATAGRELVSLNMSKSKGKKVRSAIASQIFIPSWHVTSQILCEDVAEGE